MENNEKKNLIINSSAREVYGLDSTPFTRLGSFESEIWEVYKNNVPYILRITDSTHRTLQELLSEAKWIQYLYEKGVPTIQVIKTIHGNDCFSLNDPCIFMTLFSKASGHGPSKEEITSDLIVEWGRTLGLMHKLSQKFYPDDQFLRSYSENILTSHFNKVASRIDPFIQKKFSEILGKCMELPVSHKYYGLIHSDLHLGNFYVNNGKMTIFDFDDLQLGWFVFDLAISLYYIFWNSDLKESTWYQNPKERSEQAIYFLQQLIKGYQTESKLPDEWLKMLPLFLEFRQLDLYLVFEDRFNNLTDQTAMPYLMINQYKQRILNQIPPVPLDVFDPKWYKIIRYS